MDISKKHAASKNGGNISANQIRFLNKLGGDSTDIGIWLKPHKLTL